MRIQRFLTKEAMYVIKEAALKHFSETEDCYVDMQVNLGLLID